MKKGLLVIICLLAVSGALLWHHEPDAKDQMATTTAMNSSPAPIKVAKATTINSEKTDKTIPTDCPSGHGYVIAKPFRLGN